MKDIGVKKNQKLTLVFDLDEVLTVQSTLAFEERRYLIKKSALIAVEAVEHQICLGAIELMQALFSKDNINVAFFSAGPKERNVEFVKQFLTISLGKEKYELIQPSVVVLSRDDLTKEDSQWATTMHLAYGIPNGNPRKDVSKALTLNGALDHTILIDDNIKNIHRDQVHQFLWSPRPSLKYNDLLHAADSSTFYYRHHTLFYIAGVLSKCIQAFEKGEIIAQSQLLFNLNFKPSSARHFSYQPFEQNMRDKTYYEEGLAFLKKQNNAICFTTKKEYQQVMAQPIDKIELTQMFELQQHLNAQTEKKALEKKPIDTETLISPVKQLTLSQ